MEAEAHDRALRQLQDELIVLKSKYEQLKLSKTPAGKSADAPFPITITVTVDALPVANRYDVDHLDLKIKLSSSILQDPPGATAVSVAVLNPEIPAILQTRISKQLHSNWLAGTTNAAAAAAEVAARGAVAQIKADDSSSSSGSAAGPFGLAGLLNHAQEGFVQLITLLPGLIEPYEGTDASGATQRRYAVVENAAAIAAAEAAAEAAAAAETEAGALAVPLEENASLQQASGVAGPAAATAASARRVAAVPTSLTAAPAPSNAPAASTRGSSSSSKSLKSSAGTLTAVASGTAGAPVQLGPSGVQPAAEVPAPAAVAAAATAPSLLAAAAAGGGGRTSSSKAAAAAAAAAARMAYRPPVLRSPTATHSGAALMDYTTNNGPPPQQQQQQHSSTQWQHHQQHSAPPAADVAIAESTAPPAAALSADQQQQQQQQQKMHSAAANSAAGAPAGQPSSSQAVVQHAIGGGAVRRAAAADIVSSSTGAHTGQPGTIGTAGSGRGRGRGRERWLAGRAVAAPAAGRGAYGGRGFQQQQQQLPAHVLAQQDLATVQRRYGKSFKFAQQQQQQVGEEQQQQQQQPERQQPQQQQQQQQQGEVYLSAPSQFSLMLRPTDPLWGARRGALHVTGTVSPEQYPAPGSITLTVNPSLNVTAAETWVLQSRLEQEMLSYVGRVRQLMSLLKWLENYAGSVLEESYQAQQQLFGQEQQQQQDEQQQQQQQQHPPGTGSTNHGKGQQYKGRDFQYWDRPQQQQQSQLTKAGWQQQQPLVAVRPSVVAAGAGAAAGGIKILRAAKPGAQKSSTAAAVADVAAVCSSADAWGGEKHAAAAAAQQAPAGVHGWPSSSGEEAGASSSSSSGGSSRELFPSGHKLFKPQRDLFAGDDYSSSNSSRHTGSSSSSEYTTATDSETQDSSSTDTDSEHDGEPQDEVQLHAESAADGAGSGPGGYALTLNGLTLDNIGVMEVVHAHLQLVCSRCQASLAVVLTAEGGHLATARTTAAAAAAAGPASPSKPTTTAAAAAARISKAGPSSSSSSSSKSRAFEWGGACSVCNQSLGVLLRPRFVHEGNNVIAGVKVQGCQPLDLLPSVYGATCADCDAVGALRGLQVGVAASRKCSHCHRTMSCHIPAASFVPRGPPSAAAAAAGTARPRKKAGGPGSKGGGGVLQEGTPLPMNGACKHYRHSYRWLRFPCCGQRYPCDLCHEEAAADGHDAVWATRMVCGFCSREQPLDKSCKYCGKRLATSAAQPSGRNTRFWEGGKGCRNVKMLDRRDAHKYRNSKAKTKSAKARRVGPKPLSGSAAGGGGGGGSSS